MIYDINKIAYSIYVDGTEAHVIEGHPEDTLHSYLSMLDVAQKHLEQAEINLKETSSHFADPLRK